MRIPVLLLVVTLGTILSGAGALARAQHLHGRTHAAPTAPPDTRVPVHLPAAMRAHTLTNMRDHLRALAEIQEALSREAYEVAARTAEERLGMSSLALHGAHEVAQYMPAGMREIGTVMHRSASRFALEAQNSAVTHDPKPALAALAATTQSCVACHAAYRLKP